MEQLPSVGSGKRNCMAWVVTWNKHSPGVARSIPTAESRGAPGKEQQLPALQRGQRCRGALSTSLTATNSTNLAPETTTTPKGISKYTAKNLGAKTLGVKALGTKNIMPESCCFIQNEHLIAVPVGGRRWLFPPRSYSIISHVVPQLLIHPGRGRGCWRAPS